MSGKTEPADWVPPHNCGLGETHVFIALLSSVKSSRVKMSEFDSPRFQITVEPTAISSIPWHHRQLGTHVILMTLKMTPIRRRMTLIGTPK